LNDEEVAFRFYSVGVLFIFLFFSQRMFFFIH
jgi:hypothetical protein